MKSQCLTGFACLAVLVASTLQAAPPKRSGAVARSAAPSNSAPDFWYVVPDDAPVTASSIEQVRGIVIPSSVTPTVWTTPSGSVVSWLRPNGTKQSFVVQGVSSLSFRPGPLKGTTYVPFVDARRMTWNPNPTSCCSCASWQNSEESLEQLQCVLGCYGCGCEGCICSPSYPCPLEPALAMRLEGNDGTTPDLRFTTSAEFDTISVGTRDESSVLFGGRRLSAKLLQDGVTEIANPSSISVSRQAVSRAIVRGDSALYSWSSPDATLIIEQPKSIAAPSIDHESIVGPGYADPSATMAVRLQLPTNVCVICGYHPNSTGDNERMECVAGDYTCTRCITFPCLTPEE